MAKAPGIVSPSDGGAPKGGFVPMTSARALAEFKVACAIWFSHMNEDDQRAAVQHAIKSEGKANG